ncbi:MAG: undecaprenyl-diphosphatase UppP [Patescibacteria group bacterium]|jgi:undecaprenyl-diphosphatase|nr:undecaprenyl-diphosphatase UppP [Patescibacteria group bacterium]
MLFHYLQAIILGVVQGITEFLPVSSTAHLIIVQDLFNLDPATYGLSFDMFTNLGTVLAVIIFFWNDLKDIFGSLRLMPPGKMTGKQKLPWLIILATIPVGLIGMALESRIESDFRSLYVIATSLVVVGLVMIAAEKSAGRRKPKENVTPRPFQVIWTGLSQAIALIPGVSRSGITISTGMFLGMDRVTAARYSFLLSVPITAAATLKKLADFGSEVSAGNVASDVLVFYFLGAITSFIAGYFTLRFLLSFYSRSTLTSFAYYRFALALVLIIMIQFGGL